MDGLMQPRALTLAHVFERAESLHAHKRIVGADGTATTYGTWALRVRRLAAALDAWGLPSGARVATLAANHARHLEAYAAVPIGKRVLHTVNTRLSEDHLAYVLDHAGAEVLFVDRSLLDGAWAQAHRLPNVRHWVVLPDHDRRPLPADPRVVDYEDLLARHEPLAGSFEDGFSLAEEHLAAGLCYTSGSSGPPKGVVYSHRSTVLHCLGVLAAGHLGLSERDVVMPIVPMFHAHAWGLPYAAMLSGADLVLPGPSSAPEHLAGLLEEHRVTVSAAVPTVWTDLLPAVEGRDLTALRLLLAGGSAVSTALSEGYRRTAGLPLTHSWGMTEVSPVGAVGGLRSRHDALDHEERVHVEGAQGQPMPLVRLRVRDVETGRDQPWDGVSRGELQVAGPWVASGYHSPEGGQDVSGESSGDFTDDGWLRTGDVATIDEQGYLRLVDRLKDLIKSGGEWISSVQLEQAIASHPGVAEVAVVARPDERWAERPVAFVVRRPGVDVDADELREHLRPLVAKWWLPDHVEFLDGLPRTGTGKLFKPALRERADAGIDAPAAAG